MKKFKIFILLNIMLIFTACGTVKEGFKNQKKNSSDEFLVEKKLPLVMPPNYNELPMPKTNENQIDSKKNIIKTLITNQEDGSVGSADNKGTSKNIEESILKKIKKN